MKKGRSITVSAPAKVHLLGEWSAVWGKPAILTAIDLRLRVTISQGRTVPSELLKLQKLIEKIVKKELKLKKIPLYSLEISSDIPVGSGLGSSAAVSSAYIGALLSYLRVNWDLNLIYKLTYEAEKIFAGSPSGGDQSPIIYGKLIWFRKEDNDLKLIHPLPFSIPQKLSRNFVLINSGKPAEATAEIIAQVKTTFAKKPGVLNSFLEDQEKLVKELLIVIKEGSQKEFMRIIKQGQRNLESIGVVPKSIFPVITRIERSGGVVKIIGAGGKKGAAGMLLAYHPNKAKLLKIVKSFNLPYLSPTLGVEGVRKEL